MTGHRLHVDGLFEPETTVSQRTAALASPGVAEGALVWALVS